MARFGETWRNLSVSKKLYIVIGVMATLIATELFTLLFAMNTLSSVRGFVTGEALWSKAEKDAALDLKQYALTRDETYFKNFREHMEVSLGDRKARLELQKPHPDLEMAKQGFHQGRIHDGDIPGLINLVLRFHDICYLKKALIIWGQADDMATEFMAVAETLHFQIQAKESHAVVAKTLSRIDSMNDKLTVLEDDFSYALGAGSRWLEHVLMITLVFAVLLVETTGLTLTISFSRNLSRGLKELNLAASAVGRGEFDVHVPVRAKDELGLLAMSINKMASDLKTSYGAKEKAENVSQMKSLFLANMSHEMRTPLNAIIGFTDLLKSPDITPEEHHQFLNIISRTGDALTKIINDILDLSKVEAGHLEIEKSDFSLGDLLNEIHLMIKTRWTEKPVELIFKNIGHVPDKIFTDSLRLRQILMNLIGNAMKFTDHGKINLTYEIIGSQLVFSVEDTGVGISNEQRKFLFESFSQVDSSSSRKHEGTGLGLVLSRKLAQLLGGDVILKEGELGKGSTFVATIKYETKTVEAADSDTLKTPTDRLKNKKVLLVEDIDDNRFLLTHKLKKYEIQITEAVNGLEGVQKAMSGDYDLVLMDIQMPVMDGVQATQELRKNGFAKPIIALTAHAMLEDKMKCMNAGCNEYLTKPIHFDNLLKVMTAFIE